MISKVVVADTCGNIKGDPGGTSFVDNRWCMDIKMLQEIINHVLGNCYNHFDVWHSENPDGMAPFSKIGDINFEPTDCPLQIKNLMDGTMGELKDLMVKR